MNFERLNQLNEEIIALLELKRRDAGEEISFTDFNDAVMKLKQKFDQGEIKSYCPKAETINYNGREYELCLVLGINKPEPNSKPPMDPHGMNHYLTKHVGDKKKRWYSCNYR